MISQPFHSTKLPIGAGAVSSTDTAASIGPALTTGPIMPLITIMNMIIQQYINKSIIVHAITHTKSIKSKNKTIHKFNIQYSAIYAMISIYTIRIKFGIIH